MGSIFNPKKTLKFAAHRQFFKRFVFLLIGADFIQRTHNHRLYISRLCSAYGLRLQDDCSNQRLFRSGKPLGQCGLLMLSAA